MNKNIKLSKYADDLMNKYYKTYSLNCNRLIKLLNKNIKKDLYVVCKSTDAVEVYNNLMGWLFKFYPNKLKEAFETIDFNYENFKKYMIFCFIITFFRDEEKAHILYNSLKENEIVNRLLSYDDEKFELYTNSFGVITFYNINSFLASNAILLNKYRQMGINVIDGCHEISEFVLKNDESLCALTGILTNPLDEKIFHSVVLDDKMIIDIPNGIIMSKDDYFKLNNFEIISQYIYKKLKKEDSIYEKYDESKTLFPLLRCMLYKLYINEKKIINKYTKQH